MMKFLSCASAHSNTVALIQFVKLAESGNKCKFAMCNQQLESKVSVLGAVLSMD